MEPEMMMLPPQSMEYFPEPVVCTGLRQPEWLQTLLEMFPMIQMFWGI